MKTRLPHIFFALLVILSSIHAQTPDSLAISLTQDSTLVLNDTLSTDSISISQSDIILSKDSLDAPVQYDAVDSMKYDIHNKKVHLYGNAVVKYNTISLTANHIVFDLTTNEVLAQAYPDSSGTMAGFPNFKDGDQDFDSKKMRFNFKTKKGIVYDVTTEQQDMIVHGAKSKFAREQLNDSTEVDVIYSEDAIFTTCTADHPHFGIRSKKQKVIPNKIVIVGPSNLEIMDIPTPIWLPFGVFPLSKTRTTGLLFPNDYGYQNNLGMGFEGLGWFFPIGDNVNLSLRSRFYWNGTFGVDATTQYVKNYKYNGNFKVGFDRRVINANDGTQTSSNSYVLQWSHNQSPKAHPTAKLGGSIDLQIGEYGRNTSNTPENNIDRTLRSNLNFTKTWRNKPYSFTAGFKHTQNTGTRKISVSLPKLNFRTGPLYPLKHKVPTGGRKWYEEITLNYTADASNQLNGIDSTFFTQQTLDEAKYGIKQDISTGTSFKVLKYFNVNPSAQLTETTYFTELSKRFEEDLVVNTIQNNDGTTRLDTVKYGNIIADKINKLKSFRNINASVSVNTQVFSTMQFKGEKRLGIRHVLKPSISFNYTPDNTNENLRWFDQVQDSTSRELIRYSHFEGGIYGQPSYVGKKMALAYSFNNIFEAKYFSKKDTIDKKLKLFNNIRVSGNYNFAADSLNWSRVSLRGNQPLFKGLTNLQIQGTWDPYYNKLNEAGTRAERTNDLYWDTHGKILQFVGLDISANSTLNISKFKQLFQGEKATVDKGNASSRSNANKEDELSSLFKSFNLRHNFKMKWERTETGKDTLFISTNSLDFSGSFKLTDAWNFNIRSVGYNFIQKRVTYPYLEFTRDLHCWQMSFSWAPYNNAYNFSIYAKPGVFDFLKAPYRKFPQTGSDPFR